MDIRVYNWEHYNRKKTWFVAFGIVLAGIILLSIFLGNLFWAIILFLFTGSYILFSLTKNKHINITIRDTWFVVDTRLWSWQWIDSFVVEVDSKTQEWKNIIIVLKNNDYMIFTFDDIDTKRKDFVTELQQYIPLIESFPQSSMDKLVRRLQL